MSRRMFRREIVGKKFGAESDTFKVARYQSTAFYLQTPPTPCASRARHALAAREFLHRKIPRNPAGHREHPPQSSSPLT